MNNKWDIWCVWLLDFNGGCKFIFIQLKRAVYQSWAMRTFIQSKAAVHDVTWYIWSWCLICPKLMFSSHLIFGLLTASLSETACWIWLLVHVNFTDPVKTENGPNSRTILSFHVTHVCKTSKQTASSGTMFYDSSPREQRVILYHTVNVKHHSDLKQVGTLWTLLV